MGLIRPSLVGMPQKPPQPHHLIQAQPQVQAMVKLQAVRIVIRAVVRRVVHPRRRQAPVSPRRRQNLLQRNPNQSQKERKAVKVKVQRAVSLQNLPQLEVQKATTMLQECILHRKEEKQLKQDKNTVPTLEKDINKMLQ